jgi:uncharacterized caspase-like protein
VNEAKRTAFMEGVMGMKKSLRVFVILLAFSAMGPLPGLQNLTGPSTAHASETRGLAVVAKDPATNQSGEVRLYNKSYAVIIGIDKYQNLPADRQLKNAVGDAKGVQEVLTKNYQFDRIFTLYDQQATKDRILELLTEELPQGMSDQDSVFIFWAGHGNQQKSKDGEMGYLIPYDGNPAKLRTVVTMAEIRDTISKAIPAKHVFYVMDACYGGLLAATRSVDSRPRRDLDYLKEITKERVRQVLTAGGKDQEVLDGGRKGHSVFTGRLIEALEAAGDFITANEIQAILKEKVFNDARSRNHNQTPGFGTLYGNGDFVFIPSLQQKLAESENEEEKLKSELRALAEKERKQQSEAQKLKAEREKQTLLAKLKAEELRKKQLEEEEQRRLKETAEREAAQARYTTEREKLVNLRVELEKRKKSATGVTDSIETAGAEIRRINDQITDLEKSFAPFLKQITDRYDQKIKALEALKRDEFEKERDFKARITKEKEQAEKGRQEERDQLDSRLAAETDPLRGEIKRLSEKEYTLDPSTIALELGLYDVDKEQFPVALKNKTPDGIKIAMNGSIPLPSSSARVFKQQWQSGLVRPEVRARPDGEIVRVAIANDAENYLMIYVNGEFVNIVEKKKRVEDEEWENALKSATRKAMQGYIKKYPDGRYLAQARQKDEEYSRNPTRPVLPFTVNEAVWKIIEDSEYYRNLPRPRTANATFQYEQKVELKGWKNRGRANPPPSQKSEKIEVTPLGDKISLQLTTAEFITNNYECGHFLSLGTISNGQTSVITDSIDELKGSLFPLRIGAQLSVRYNSANPAYPKSGIHYSLACQVTDRDEAKKLNPKLPGVAWKVHCQHETQINGNTYNGTEYDYFLEDLGLFLSAFGQHKGNLTEWEFVLPAVGNTTVKEAGSVEITKVYKSSDWTVGE